jgi:sterol desaturase/sphingolipid hydroxylase (fatty acid hydroxylase superfamily)
LHWQPLYRLVHALHHRNINVGPWSGISMHPIEHVLYFSGVLIHFVVPSHPVHVIFHLYNLGLNPAASHSGFAGLVIGGKRRMALGDFFHQLHHRHFHCNFGTAEVPLDKWFGSFHDGTPEAGKRIRRRASGRQPVAAAE